MPSEPPVDAATEARVQAIEDLLAGRATAAEVADRLGVSEQRVWQLRTQFLAGARAALAPRPAGRPAKAPPTAAEIEVEQLRLQLAEARLEAEAAPLRLALACTQPDVLVSLPGAPPRAKSTPKKKPKKAKGKGRRKKGGRRAHR